MNNINRLIFPLIMVVRIAPFNLQLAMVGGINDMAQFKAEIVHLCQYPQPS